MSQGLREIQASDLAAEVERELLPRLTVLLRQRARGHCMRVADLDRDQMVRLCSRLRAEIPEAEVVILGGDGVRMPAELTVSSTKLVELRNPYPDGSLRPPLLAFIPNELRAAAEDSFGKATFEAVDLGDVYDGLRLRLLQELPGSIRGALGEGLRRLTASPDAWPFADPVSVVRFLLTAKLNGNDPEAIGAALFELALVPDFELLAEPVRTPDRMMRNRACVSSLTWSAKSERGRVLDLGLRDRTLRNRLGEFLAEAGVEDPQGWTRRIVLDRTNWPLAFHRWQFEDDDAAPDSIYIGDVSTDLPSVPEDTSDSRLEALVGQQVLVLGQGGARKFSARFRVDPHPSKVHGLTKFVAQVISKEEGPVGLVRGKSIWKGNVLEATIGFDRLNNIEWEEGWHFVRVLAQMESGDLIPLVDENGDPLPWSATDSTGALPRPNESDLFYVVSEVEEPPEPPQRAVQRDDSHEHAKLRLQFSALSDGRDPLGVNTTSVEWLDRHARGRASGTEMLEVKFGRDGTVHVPVSRTLKVLEQKILAGPDGPLSWRIPVVLGRVGAATGIAARWPAGEGVDAFLDARKAWFDAIRGGTRELVTQGADLHQAQPLAIQYADAYQHLLQDLLHRSATGSDEDRPAALADLRRMLAVDTIVLAVTDHRGRRREAALVAPTHPLRALWLVTWAEVGERWVQAAQHGAKEFVSATRDALLRQLAPVGFPPVLMTDMSDRGRLMTAVDNVHPYWTLYAPSSEVDPRGLLGDLCSAFGLPEPGIDGASIDGNVLASRVQRYLVQHPYVHSLIINAFNAGRAGVLADMLLNLQRHPVFADISYDIRLFVPDADAPGVGEALAELLSPSGSISAREADAFTTPADSHLRPKLALAIRPVDEFRAAPDENAAHLSLLFDVFPAEEVGAARAAEDETGAPIHGLAQEFEVVYREDEISVAWHRQPRHGAALPLPGKEELTDLLGSLPALISAATATVATGQAGVDLRPVVTLALNASERALLHQVHEVSDWVLTLDRNMGIEFFDHGGLADRPEYLIDHTPGAGGAQGHNLTITSRSIAELETMLRPVMEQYRLRAEVRHAVALLDQLRSLSGRLALKLISSSSQRAEALGLALSRLYLEHQGVFSNQVVVPLDAHLEIYRELQRQADELGEDVSFKRTDLALFDLNAAARTVTCRLVEVKCYTAVGDFSAYGQLKDRIAEQIQQSEQVLAKHFDPRREPVDRADRLVKTREFVKLLEFYLERGLRYGVLGAGVAAEARLLLHSLEDGYDLVFTRSAVIFDFEKPGTESAEVESGIEYHRIGIDLIQQLVDSAAPTPEERAQTEEVLPADASAAERSAAELRRRREKAPSIPRLEHAAFQPIPRVRTLSRDELATRRRGTMPDISPDTTLSRKAAERDTEKDHYVGHRVDQTHPMVETAPPPEEPASGVEAESRKGDEQEAQDSGVLVKPSPVEHEAPDEPGSAGDQGGVSEGQGISDAPAYDVLLGVTAPSPQFGLFGEIAGRKVGLDLNHTHTISLFGVQGGGKSYTLGTVAEMASLPISGINRLPQPLATVIFHYSPTMDYRPEFTSMVEANSDEDQIAALREQYGAEPKALSDVLLLVPPDKLEERRAEYPGIAVHPLRFAAAELQASHWRFLMGAVGNQATYIRQLTRIMRSLRDDLTLEGLRRGIDGAAMPDHLKDIARMRLDLAATYIDDQSRLSSLIRPGRLIIVDLRDEFIEKDEALGLFVVLLQMFADAKHDGRPFNKLVVFDEAHKYIESPDLVAGLVEVVREMRHKGTSIMVASQDPPSVPVQLIELSSQIILHKFNSPAWLKHIQKANAALADLTPEKMAHLRPGEAYVWSSKATDEAFSRGAVKVRCRPRVTQHGGATKTAVED